MEVHTYTCMCVSVLCSTFLNLQTDELHEVCACAGSGVQDRKRKSLKDKCSALISLPEKQSEEREEKDP